MNGLGCGGLEYRFGEQGFLGLPRIVIVKLWALHLKLTTDYGLYCFEDFRFRV